MRRLALALYLMMAVRGTATSCVTVVPDAPLFFKDAESVFFARAEVTLQGPHVFHADEIVRGTMKLGETVSVQRRDCVFVNSGERYFMVRAKCDQAEECVRFADESHAPALLHYLANAHAENHEAVMAMFLRWHRQELSLAEIGEWLDTVAAQPRSQCDDELVLWLASELSDFVTDLRLFAEHLDGGDAFARPLLHDVARVMEEFPPGPAADFDARAEEVGEDAPRREELEDQLREALRGARESAEWRKKSEEAYEIASRRESVTPQ